MYNLSTFWFSTCLISIKVLAIGDGNRYKSKLLALFFLHLVLIGWNFCSRIQRAEEKINIKDQFYHKPTTTAPAPVLEATPFDIRSFWHSLPWGLPENKKELNYFSSSILPRNCLKNPGYSDYFWRILKHFCVKKIATTEFVKRMATTRDKMCQT